MLKKKTNLVDGSMYNEKNSILHFRFYFFSFLSYGNYARVLTSTISREYIMTYNQIHFCKEYEIRQSSQSNRWFIFKDDINLQGDKGFGDPYRTLEDAIQSINKERKI